MRATLVFTVLLYVFAVQIEQGESILPFCKGLVADCKKYIPQVKDYLYATVCSKKCKQPMTVPLIEKFLEEKFRIIFPYVVGKLKPTCDVNLPSSITPEKLIKVAREFEHCPKVNSKPNLCHWDMKKDKAIISELTKKAISKGLPIAAPLMSEAGKCDKCTPIAHAILADAWNGKGDAPCVKKMIDEAFEKFCK